MFESIKPYIPEIITFVAGLSAWGYERKKRIESLKQTKTATQQGVVDLYQEALDDLKKRYDEKFDDLSKEIDALRKGLTQWKNKYKNLKSEFEEYKEKHDKSNK